jgi:UDP-N-acetylglucosamine 2-epimerase (non-hydrolysing)
VRPNRVRSPIEAGKPLYGGPGLLLFWTEMKFLLVAGARPNFMKIAPLLEAFGLHRDALPDLEVMLVHTGQHYDRQMSDDFFRDLGIPAPDVNLGVGPGSHAQQTARVMTAFEEVCLRYRPDWVVVVGDVNSTMACAITAKKLGIPVAHVEAGLRSRDLSMPEEINRLCTDVIADLLFTTDRIASANLEREGVAPSRIFFAGNTMIDTLLRHIERARSHPLPPGIEPGSYSVLTLHRPANVDCRETLTAILETIAAAIPPGIPMVFPAHPRTRNRLEEFRLSERLNAAGHLILIEPLSYLPFIGLVARSRMVLTDSGGIQEETTVLGIPCITMRPNTERPITCEIGTNILVGTDPARIRAAIDAVFNREPGRGSVPEKWDGHAAERIVETLLKYAAGAADLESATADI